MTKSVVVAMFLLTACGGANVGGTAGDGSTATNPDAGGNGVTDGSTQPNNDFAANIDGATTPSADAATAQDSGPPPTGAPAAPTNFQMINQGASDVVLTWTASVAGDHPVDHYNVRRNGGSPNPTKATTYTDSMATNATTPGYGPAPYQPATVYAYTVSAVDTTGVEGAQQKNCVAWMYHAGTDFWTSSTNNYNYNVSQQDNGANGVTITVNAASNEWQPFSAGPFLHNMTPTQWAMEVGAFNYMTIDFMPSVAGQTIGIDLISRVSPGDNYNSATVVIGGTDAKFGPAAQTGKWTTYKIPFLNKSGTDDGESLQMGIGTYTASISGTMMTVEKLLSGINVQGSSYLYGKGVTVGSGSSTATFINSTSGSTGLAGTYTITPSQTVASTTITAQRTNLYKFGITDTSGVVGHTYSVNNIGFTTE